MALSKVPSRSAAIERWPMEEELYSDIRGKVFRSCSSSGCNILSKGGIRF